MKSFIRSALTLGYSFLIAVGTLHAQEAEPIPKTNTMCPILTDEPVDPKISVEYQGKTVFLCCNKCRRKFLADPEKYLSALPQFSKANASNKHDHDHKHDHGEAAGLSRLISFLGKFHPIVVHFPIALIIIAGLLEFIGTLRNRDAWINAGRVNLILSALGAAVAAPLGWAAAANTKYPGLENTLFWHRWLGTSLSATVIVAAILIWIARQQKNRRLAQVYRVLLALLCLLVIITGHYGGTLVFGPEQLSW